MLEFKKTEEIPGCESLDKYWVIVFYFTKEQKQEFDKFFENYLSNLSIVEIARMTSTYKILSSENSTFYEQEPVEFAKDFEYKVSIHSPHGGDYESVIEILKDNYKITDIVYIAKQNNE